MLIVERVSWLLFHGVGAITAVVGNTIFSPTIWTGPEILRYLKYVKVSFSL